MAVEVSDPGAFNIGRGCIWTSFLLRLRRRGERSLTLRGEVKHVAVGSRGFAVPRARRIDSSLPPPEWNETTNRIGLFSNGRRGLGCARRIATLLSARPGRRENDPEADAGHSLRRHDDGRRCTTA